MKKSRTLLFFVSFILFLSLTVGMASADVIPVKIFDSSDRAASLLDSIKIMEIVTSEFQLDAEDTPFRTVDIKVVYEKNQPDYLIVHLMDKLSWSFETARIELDNGYTASKVIMDYIVTDEDMVQDAQTAAFCPDNSVQMVLATCEIGINSAVQSIKAVASIAQISGFKRFVGGICDLAIDTSEKVFKCWVQSMLSQKKRDDTFS